MKRNLFVALILALACLLVCATASAAAKAPECINGIASDSEWELLRLINSYRMENGAAPLSMTDALQGAAQKRADELDQKNDAKRPNGAAWSTVLSEFSVAYSNTSYSYMQRLSDASTAPGIILTTIRNTGIADTKAFREAMLSKVYTHVGIGSTKSGYWYWIFTDEPGTPSVSAALVTNGIIYTAGASIDDMGLVVVEKCASHGEGYIPVTKGMCNTTSGSSVATVNVYATGAATPTSILTIPNAYVKPTSVTLSSTLTVYKGKTNLLIPAFAPDIARSTLNQWTSSDTSVVSVGATGLVTGLKEGTATVTFTGDNGVTASCAVTVKDRADSVTLSMESLVLGLGQSCQAEYALAPAGSTEAVSWSLYPVGTKVATVSDTGLITAGKTKGKAYVICTTANGKTDRIKLTVVNSSQAVQSVKISMAAAQVAPGGSIRLSAIAYPGTAAKRAIEWISSDASVATVNAEGIVTGVKAGTVTITARASSGVSKTCVVKVQDIEVASIVFKRSAATIYAGQRGTLSPTIQPASVAKTALTWASSDDSVASVSSTGQVTAHKKGSALITATASNGVKGAFTINVKEYAVTKVKFGKTSATMAIGNSGVIRSAVGPDKASNKTLVWTSSNSSVATVDQTGRVTAVGAGTAVITAQSQSNPEAKASCKITVRGNAYARPAADYTKGKISAWVTAARYNAEGNLEVTVCYYNSKSRNVDVTRFGDEVLLYTSNTLIFKRLPISHADASVNLSEAVVPARQSKSVTYTFSMAEYPELANQNLRKLNVNSRIG